MSVRHIRHRVNESDLYRQPNVRSAIPKAGDSLNERIHKMVGAGLYGNLPFEKRVEKIANMLFKSRNRDLDGNCTRTTAYIQFEARIRDLLEQHTEA